MQRACVAIFRLEPKYIRAQESLIHSYSPFCLVAMVYILHTNQSQLSFELLMNVHSIDVRNV
jgi:hypothetical protein